MFYCYLCDRSCYGGKTNERYHIYSKKHRAFKEALYDGVIEPTNFHDAVYFLCDGENYSECYITPDEECRNINSKALYDDIEEFLNEDKLEMAKSKVDNELKEFWDYGELKLST